DTGIRLVTQLATPRSKCARIVHKRQAPAPRTQTQYSKVKESLNASSEYALARPLFGHASSGTGRNGSGLSSDGQKVWQRSSFKGDILQRPAASQGIFARSSATQPFATRRIAGGDGLFRDRRKTIPGDAIHPGQRPGATAGRPEDARQGGLCDFTSSALGRPVARRARIPAL